MKNISLPCQLSLSSILLFIYFCLISSSCVSNDLHQIIYTSITNDTLVTIGSERFPTDSLHSKDSFIVIINDSDIIDSLNAIALDSFSDFLNVKIFIFTEENVYGNVNSLNSNIKLILPLLLYPTGEIKQLSYNNNNITELIIMHILVFYNYGNMEHFFKYNLYALDISRHLNSININMKNNHLYIIVDNLTHYCEFSNILDFLSIYYKSSHDYTLFLPNGHNELSINSLLSIYGDTVNIEILNHNDSDFILKLRSLNCGKKKNFYFLKFVDSYSYHYIDHCSDIISII